MYALAPITGAGLSAQTLCLTFDDGPGESPGVGSGPHTLKLAEYLSDQGIPATFFMVGKHAEQYSTLLPQIQRLGHLIANHTYHHPELPPYIAGGGDPVIQILRTDDLIKSYVDGPITFVRPPYGSWSPDVARALNGNLETALAHAGPINWDIDGGDWTYWQNGGTPDDCAANYLSAIDAAGKGIVLMHDSTADMDAVKWANQTCATTQLLIPRLTEKGYSFVRLDEVPDALAVGQTLLQIALLASNGKYVSPQLGGGGQVLVNGPAIGPWEPLGVDYVAPGKVALRASNGLYLSPQNGGGGEVLANGPAIGRWEPLDLIPVGTNKAAFRTITGHFLTRETADDGRLLATVTRMQDWELFIVVDLAG
jgi:peptidoglycan/xylan/chitin deacetylase (PgdA/CDA1 family)